jgi:hypothetical protein
MSMRAMNAPLLCRTASTLRWREIARNARQKAPLRHDGQSVTVVTGECMRIALAPVQKKDR